jgi:hypothetical protein
MRRPPAPPCDQLIDINGYTEKAGLDLDDFVREVERIFFLLEPLEKRVALTGSRTGVAMAFISQPGSAN